MVGKVWVQDLKTDEYLRIETSFHPGDKYIPVELYVYHCPPCMYCAKADLFPLPSDLVDQWLDDGKFIQDVFPMLSKDEREILISGTHSECWNKMFGDDE